MTKKPTIGITMGDPAGIGPEVVLGALADGEVSAVCTPIVIGHAGLLGRCSEASGVRMTDARIINVETPRADSIRPGLISAEAGAAAEAYIRRACEMGLAGEVDAIATAPINKESLRLAGVEHIGHTEMLAAYMASPASIAHPEHTHSILSLSKGAVGDSQPLTLFITENMRIFFLSRHLSLRDAVDYVTADRVYEFIVRVNEAMGSSIQGTSRRDSSILSPSKGAGILGFDSPRIGLAALNPHASDGGQFGTEERDHLIPAAERARTDGIDVTGPIGADSIFNTALEGRFDCVISLYHDQGHIAAKTRDFHGTVTATLGLPVLRTSVDHGTALDIAWKGIANPTGMKKAILAAVEMVGHKNRY